MNIKAVANWNNLLYIGSQTEEKLYVIDINTGKTLRTIKVFCRPQMVNVYEKMVVVGENQHPIAHRFQHYISVYDIEKEKVIKDIWLSPWVSAIN